MRKCLLWAATGMFLFGTGLAWAQKPVAKPRLPTPVRTSVLPPQIFGPFAVRDYSVLPGTVTFTSSNPAGSVTGTPSTTTVQFKTTANPTFSVYAKAAAPNFSCSGGTNPPVNSVTLTCSGATGAAVCQSGTLTLTDTGNGVKVAGGSGNGNPNTFNVTYTFQDSWTYSAGSSCTLSVSYIYTEP
jgi:hypothetical protein